MDDSRHAMRPVTTPRPRGSPRLDAFSLKLDRRLTLFQRGAPELWLLIETDPAVRTFCERPGYVQVGEARRLVDFWVEYDSRQEFVLLSDSFPDTPYASPQGREPGAVPIRSVRSTDLAAAHVWIDNWRHMLPCLVATRGLVPSSLQRAVETFVTIAHTLLEIEREFALGDPALVRAAVFGLLHAGRISAIDLRTEPLSLLTRFTATGAS
ncbi:hypothetical protein QHI69_38110 (plasmid) [Burkholderia gladioli pv. gladioli]|uniref:Uncharacterized protein n=1 Tax=Burkholderia gladioli TaxID=28095 RepID=A0AAW3ESS4_BURGA|nr:hypothetical protein [Burkholderia gladioli]AJW93684.1 hypothetical protein BM43_7459 [Burkholderia gladioli]ASD84614.1 hypothetical protein CEJ98_37210 [Burkholderia gladioli pv. gladioli]AWY49868.1 hypothetical protein A8H28_01010 [Burkholderia gladioli pv. gladioli]KGC09960.1 hypothetical protein DM48_6855 [Burkholderia gladioli]MDJ1167734.1 hypothetical protein [Burkholderia gladioli pv. gladioli]